MIPMTRRASLAIKLIVLNTAAFNLCQRRALAHLMKLPTGEEAELGSLHNAKVKIF